MTGSVRISVAPSDDRSGADVADDWVLASLGVEHAGWTETINPHLADALIEIVGPDGPTVASDPARPLLELRITAQGGIDANIIRSDGRSRTHVTQVGDASSTDLVPGIVRDFLNGETVLTPSAVRLGQLVEKLAGAVRELADDNDRLRDLLAKADSRNRDLELEQERYRELLDAWARYGVAASRGDPVSTEEAATFAGGLARTLRDMTIGGIVGNRVDAGVVWAAKEGWSALDPFAKLITEIIDLTPGIAPF